jgi:hypothetical protein
MMKKLVKIENYLLSNSEWRVKVVGSQSCMRLGDFKDRSEGPETYCCWGKKYWGRDLMLRLVSSLVEYD